MFLVSYEQRILKCWPSLLILLYLFILVSFIFYFYFVILIFYFFIFYFLFFLLLVFDFFIFRFRFFHWSNFVKTIKVKLKNNRFFSGNHNNLDLSKLELMSHESPWFIIKILTFEIEPRTGKDRKSSTCSLKRQN